MEAATESKRVASEDLVTRDLALRDLGDSPLGDAHAVRDLLLGQATAAACFGEAMAGDLGQQFLFLCPFFK